MSFETHIANEIYKAELPLVERRAAQLFRFRNHHTTTSKVVGAVLTSIVSFLFG